MVERDSPLTAVYRPGSHGNFAEGAGVRLTETRPGSIVQVAAWRGRAAELARIVSRTTGLDISEAAGAGAAGNDRAAFGFAPGRFLLVSRDEGLFSTLAPSITTEIGTVTDLSHGRTAIRISGPKSAWVLSKFFAIDFAPGVFALHSGVSTSHHDVFAQIQRSGETQFDIYVFRSLARSFWTALCHASEEVGYEVL